MSDNVAIENFEAQALQLRPASVVMDLARLGSLYQSRLSFSRTLIRQMIREQWRIWAERFDLDANGYGEAIYRVATPHGENTFVIFSQPLDPAQRNDRVTAEAWDLAFALVDGPTHESDIASLRENVPRQEAGRCASKVLTLSRANRSTRMFDSVCNALAAGNQPDIEALKKVGYIHRTTAVYGNGKCGSADYERLCVHGAFARPFAAQMFTVFMVRHFSLAQVEHIAASQAPDTAVTLNPAIKRYIGIGNATGLGMAPFLINHPALIDRWITARETAIARVVEYGDFTPEALDRVRSLLARAQRHLDETFVDDNEHSTRNERTIAELGDIDRWINGGKTAYNSSWAELQSLLAQNYSMETQELFNSILIECYPSLVDWLEDYMAAAEEWATSPQSSLEELCRTIETNYNWALAYDFEAPGEQRYFWFRSENKEEPRLGERGVDLGENFEMPLDVARAVRRCYDAAKAFLAKQPDARLVDFMLTAPEHRWAVQRVQTMARTPYGEIRANLIGDGFRPIDLLRCKLSFFGASKFDPRSDRWVRITLFQGAPLIEDLYSGEAAGIDWFLPEAPKLGSIA